MTLPVTVEGCLLLVSFLLSFLSVLSDLIPSIFGWQMTENGDMIGLWSTWKEDQWILLSLQRALAVLPLPLLLCSFVLILLGHTKRYATSSGSIYYGTLVSYLFVSSISALVSAGLFILVKGTTNSLFVGWYCMLVSGVTTLFVGVAMVRRWQRYSQWKAQTFEMAAYF